MTQGLLELMDDEELEGVIAHELSHVRNYDILTTSIAATIAGAITYLAHMAQWGMIFGGYGGERDDEREGGGARRNCHDDTGAFCGVDAPVVLSRTREYSADETGARMVGQPTA